MGFGSWIKQKFGTKAAAKPQTAESPAEIRVQIMGGLNACLEVAGTTTFTKDAVSNLADRKGLGTRGCYEGPAQLQREPDNQADPHAVAIIVEGEKVGYLPYPANRAAGLKPGTSAPATYHLHVLREATLKAKAFVWLGKGRPEWLHTRDNPPGLTTAERANQAHRGRSSMVQEALEGGGARAAQFKRGMVDGVHYLELVGPASGDPGEARGGAPRLGRTAAREDDEELPAVAPGARLFPVRRRPAGLHGHLVDSGRPLEPRPALPQSPNLLWPEDRAWVMVTEIDFDSTIVAGSPGLVAELVADPRIEAVQIPEGADLTGSADKVNRPDA